MWTPRRIFLTLFGLLVFAGGYVGYASFLGGFDGLPPLPKHYQKANGPTQILPPVSPPGNSMQRKFELAFGPNCVEMRYPYKLEVPNKGLLFAYLEFEIIKDGPRKGWVLMSPLSVAIFGKKKAVDGVPEINTMYADVAYIQFDKPVVTVSDLNDRKMIAAELHADPELKLNEPRKGQVRINSNRRTLDDGDDVEILTPGPVFYMDDPKPGQPHIYSTNAVQLTDYQNSPAFVLDRRAPRVPTVTGIGLRVYLAREEPPKKDAPPLAGAKPPKKEPKVGVSGVEVIELDSTVEMNLWTDASASFASPGSTDRPVEKKVLDKKAIVKKDSPPPAKKLLQVKTNGPFRYDLTRDLAHFEKPAVAKPGLVEHVTITREGRTTGQDVLDSDFLDVQFQRKKPVPPAKGSAPIAKKDEPAGEGDMEVKSIRAWGETVVITSDSENLNATGTELTHDAEAKMTILKGNGQQGVQAVKDGNLLRGSELHLFGDGKELSQAHILGPGSVGLGAIDPKTNEYLKQASWIDRLVYSKQTEKGKSLDVLTFLGKPGVGKAVFRDTSAGDPQEIEADQLKVWLLPEEEKKDPDPNKPAVKKDRQDDSTKAAKPSRLEATGAVRSNAPEFIIKHADYLNVWFKDVAKLTKPEDAKPDPKGPPIAKADSKGPPVDNVDPKGPPLAKVDPKGPPPTKVEPPKEEPKKPLIILAKTIETWVNRDPTGKTEMDRVHAEGDVDIHQDPTPENDQGVDIAGKSVDMKTYVEGNYLVVTADPAADPGFVKFDKLTMWGHDIVIDQRNNTSQIKGVGSMQILSATDFEGKKLEKPTIMNIHWKHRMDFYGADKLIYFHGAVQGDQEQSFVKCEWMQVVLDRPLLLAQSTKPKAKTKPGAKKEDDSPKIDVVLMFNAPKDDDVPRPKAFQPVTVIEQVVENNKLISYSSVQASDVMMVNTPTAENKTGHSMTATSPGTTPGEARMFKPGPKDESPGTPEPKASATKKNAPRKKGEIGPDEEMKLTVVQFGGKMVANDLRKRAVFFNNVKVVHLPADRPTLPVDLRESEVPKGAVYLACKDQLEVFTTVQKEKDKDGQWFDATYQEMKAKGDVRVRKQGEFFGDADMVTYSELKGVLIFYGSKNNPAVITQQRGQGIKDKPLEGEKIYYYTKTKTFEVAGGTGISP